MKTRFNSADELFKQALKSDRGAGMPDSAVEERLNYHFMLKHSSRKLHTNSFADFGAKLFSTKALGLKAGLVSFCLVGMLFFAKVNNSQSISVAFDTCQVNHALVADTNFLAKDTCR